MVSDLKLDRKFFLVTSRLIQDSSVTVTAEQSTAQHSNLSSAAAIAGRARTKYDGSHPLTNLSRFQGDRLVSFSPVAVKRRSPTDRA